MSQERLTLRKTKEVLCLKWVARGCRISRNTVSEYLKRTEAAGLKWLLSEEITNNQLYNVFSQKNITKSNSSLCDRLASSPPGIMKKGVTV